MWMDNTAEWLSRPVSSEFEGAELGDRRRTARLQQVVDVLEARPTVGFPRAFGDGADLEAFYRLMRNDRVELDSVIEPHLEQTALRAEEYGACLVIHDTTTFKFGGEKRREGLGHTASKTQGFLGHFALAVGFDEVPTPLGVLGVETLVRRRSTKGKRRKKTSKNYEFGRWLRMLESVENRALTRFDCIHVMDREADFFDLLRRLEELQGRYVIRAARSRRATTDDDDAYKELRARMAQLEPRVTRTARLSPRSAGINPTMTATHPPREGREAKLGIAALEVHLKATDGGEPLTTNLVRVWELDPPNDEEPVDWLLMTSEPIDTDAQLIAIVDYYRARWMIEEYFKALKTGCLYEKRQLESLHTLTVALGAFIPIAWRLLLVRAVARRAPERKANTFMRGPALEILARKAGVPSDRLTSRQAHLQIAKLGGHLKRNGDPGWQTLSRGYQDLLLIAKGWEEALLAGAKM